MPSPTQLAFPLFYFFDEGHSATTVMLVAASSTMTPYHPPSFPTSSSSLLLLCHRRRRLPVPRRPAPPLQPPKKCKIDYKKGLVAHTAAAHHFYSWTCDIPKFECASFKWFRTVNPSPDWKAAPSLPCCTAAVHTAAFCALSSRGNELSTKPFVREVPNKWAII